ncbi:MAG TPA: GNAT family N-acetyltransferase [Candidatus Limnocylindria bacterium]|nr:GNAT family N-acetyltransferase [Candidatus Limnocylindria bacterium]
MITAQAEAEAEEELARLNADGPSIPGLLFRRVRLPDDLEGIAQMHTRARIADDVDERESAEEWAQWFDHPSGFDPSTDVVVGELDGRIVAFANVRVIDDADGGRDHTVGGEVDPEVRGRGIGRALLRHNIRRQRSRAAQEAAAGAKPVERRLESWSFESVKRRVRLLESEGFEVVRYFFEMLRPDLEDIADLPMPEGLELRPMLPEHYRVVWDADSEAFADHWGGQQNTDELFHLFFSGPEFRPELWRIAWDGDQVAGVVTNRIMTGFNEETGQRRGELAGVSVRRPWRGRGLARALVADSLRALRDAGMTSATLGVDAENPTGALGVYEANGFVVHRRGLNLRRPLDD